MADRRILVIAAHPDDELLGCGGTVALHTEAGDAVTSVIACEGESHRYGAGAVNQREHIDCAARKLGVTDVRLLGFPDQHLDTLTLTDLITPLEEIVREVQPQIVYCQHGGDLNLDHQILFKAAMVATRPMEPSIQAIYTFETASSTEWAFPASFRPDTWVDISTTLKEKLDAMACYESEVREYPHPRSLPSLEHRARAWGSHALLEAAEVFMTVRSIHRGGQTPT